MFRVAPSIATPFRRHCSAGVGQPLTTALRKTEVPWIAATGAGDTKRLTGYDPPQFRLRIGDYRVRFRFESGAIKILRVLPRDQVYRR